MTEKQTEIDAAGRVRTGTTTPAPPGPSSARNVDDGSPDLSPVSNVVSLATTAGFVPTRELQAKYVEAIAAQIRSGELEIDRAVFVMAMTHGGVATDIFGGPTNVMEVIGLLHIAATQLTLEPAGQ